ncbi:microtubule-severing ATPase [Saprolegnia diclina VS20]|uniref:Katanin p60 ATPase-containing subunit A1 n=1 Tax=Saprolegnia diclina (strain VS20) TaxID=1156394 RepID=T0RFU3_SAPDV|nr:microtubule-severing ATPase [Saprolegnia diclina VS20]EQC28537.1 microtubule-severing ATPase [Saprolegnia diclina VS20]|eukprot:XP_008617934.1 microtubule-severing ATPase [Saprolegnia diclina VS20]
MDDLVRQAAMARERCLLGLYDEGSKIFRACIRDAIFTRRLSRDDRALHALVESLKAEYAVIHRYTTTLDLFQQIQIQPKKPKQRSLLDEVPARKPRPSVTFKRLPTEDEFVVQKRQRRTDEKENPAASEKERRALPAKRKRVKDSTASTKTLSKHPYLKRNSISYSGTSEPKEPTRAMSSRARAMAYEAPNMESLAQSSLLRNVPSSALASKPLYASPRTSTESSTDEGLPKYSDIARAERRVDLDLIEAIERDIVDRGAKVQFEDIAGLDHVKNLLKEAVMLPRFAPHLFTEDGPLKPCNGVLLFGPPGTGKTLLAKAVANVCNTTFFNVSASTLSSKYRGESERMVRILFEMARYYAPSIIFMDEIDAIAGARGTAQEHEASRRVKTELLVQMNGILNEENGATDAAKQVMVLAATNLPWELDEAMRRRLTKRVYIPLPELVGRRELFQLNLRKMSLARDVVLDELANQTQGYSGDDITNICEAAKLLTVKRVYTPQLLQDIQASSCSERDLRQLKEQSLVVTKADFQVALGNVSKSVGTDQLHRFDAWEAEFGSK